MKSSLALFVLVLLLLTIAVGRAPGPNEFEGITGRSQKGASASPTSSSFVVD
jgi:hypothetical protein